MRFDLLLAGVVALFGLLGLLSGALNQVRHWTALLVASLAARPLSTSLTPYAAPRLGLSPAAVNVVLSVVLFAFLYIAAATVLRLVLQKLFPDRPGGRGDRAFGFGLGAAKGAALVYVLLSLLIFFERPLTTALGGPPAAARGSRAVAFARRHDLFDAVHLPALSKAEKLIEAAKSPDGLKGLENEPELRRLLDDPRLQAALHDGALSHALRSGDLSALKDDPDLKALLDDPGMLK